MGNAFCSIARYTIKYPSSYIYINLTDIPLRLFGFTKETVGLLSGDFYSKKGYVYVAREEKLFGSKPFCANLAFHAKVDDLIPLP